MSNVEPAYRLSFFRSAEIWIDSWVEHATFGRVHYRLGSENGAGMLAHLMRTAGQPDGDIVNTEVGRKVPLVQYFESLYRLSEHRTPCAVPPAAVPPALRLLAKNPRSWLTIACKYDLLARDLVALEDGQASLTDAGTAMLAALDGVRISVASRAVVLTPNQREAFDFILTSPRKWSDIHPRTRNFMVAAEWVEIKEGLPTLTALGQGIYDRENTPQEQESKLTEAQYQAFELAAKRPYKWDDVPEKTAHAMIQSGWIIVHDDLPRLTDEGRRVYDSHLAEATQKAA